MPLFKSRDTNKRKDPVIIMPYGGYANGSKLYAQARVLEDEGIIHSVKDSRLRNLYHAFKRFESDEVPGVPVRASWGTDEKVLVSDHEGYIHLEGSHAFKEVGQDISWLPLQFRLMQENEMVYKANSQVMLPASNARFGIISDIDDTILHTGVNSLLKWRLIVNSLLTHSHDRIPLDGAPEFYQLLHKGRKGDPRNPIFYLSNSPWNIFDYVEEFLMKNDFPKGTLIMRDIGLEHFGKKEFTKKNKYRKIVHILETYPNLPFVLIGDAGEMDTDIYLHIARQFPGQVHWIYIRAVKKRSKVRRVQSLIEQQSDAEVILLEHSSDGIAHARENGIID